MPQTFNPKSEIEKLSLELKMLIVKYEHLNEMFDLIVKKLLSAPQHKDFCDYSSKALENKLKEVSKDN